MSGRAAYAHCPVGYVVRVSVRDWRSEPSVCENGHVMFWLPEELAIGDEVTFGIYQDMGAYLDRTGDNPTQYFMLKPWKVMVFEWTGQALFFNAGKVLSDRSDYEKLNLVNETKPVKRKAVKAVIKKAKNWIPMVGNHGNRKDGVKRVFSPSKAFPWAIGLLGISIILNVLQAIL